MATKRFTYKPIYPGFDWEMTLGVTATPALFPEGVALRAQVREAPGAAVLTTLTTQNAKIVRISDTQVKIIVDGAASARWTMEKVMLDLVRTDGTPVHLGIRVEIAVKQPVTVR